MHVHEGTEGLQWWARANDLKILELEVQKEWSSKVSPTPCNIIMTMLLRQYQVLYYCMLQVTYEKQTNKYKQQKLKRK